MQTHQTINQNTECLFILTLHKSKTAEKKLQYESFAKEIHD